MLKAVHVQVLMKIDDEEEEDSGNMRKKSAWTYDLYKKDFDSQEMDRDVTFATHFEINE